ncbi:unnamed protein product [Clonostachys rosea f. rosea IK726]|uniref:Uncharacterized protein n=2 Tax=Bionectria ochroleuca TaxID=29856 RepID=A0A0B7K3T4_BIOOC|nr:unnamed protein product [Clonostachys rosea f. rosea IK726]
MAYADNGDATLDGATLPSWRHGLDQQGSIRIVSLARYCDWGHAAIQKPRVVEEVTFTDGRRWSSGGTCRADALKSTAICSGSPNTGLT